MSSLDAEITSLLAGWGVARTDTSSAVRDALAKAAAECGVQPVDVAVRWGRATVTTSPSGAAKLRWHADTLAKIAKKASAGEVTEVRVRSSVTPAPHTQRTTPEDTDD